MDVLSTHAQEFLTATAPEHTAVQAEMAAVADEQNFPTIGPVAGGILRTLARLTNAGTVFEFGSGFGYSASWFLRGGADHVVCTEIDADEADQGETFMAEAGWDDRVSYEVGDAIELVDGYEGPFDVVLIDNEKHRYVEALDAVRPKLTPGSVVVADNMMHGPIDFGDLVGHVVNDVAIPADDTQTTGIAEYIHTVREDPDFESVVVPAGSGIAISTYVPQ